EIQYQGFYSLLYIVQAIKKQNFQAFTQDFKIIVVSSQLQSVDGEEMVCPWKSTVLGPLKVIPQELSEIRCRNIDIVVPEPSQGRSEEEKLIILLLKEIMSDSADTIVAYRYNRRWIQIFEAVKPGGNGQLQTLLKEKGVYLITGGLGGIGLVLAEYLSGSVGARMILTGRSEFPGRNDWENWLNAHDKQDPISRKILKLQEIENKGGEVMVCRVDIADVGRMKEIIGQAEELYGQLNGVIHAAGILGRKSNLCAVEDMTEIEVEEQSRPKIAGLMALAEVLKDKKIDFCLLTSSISSILGGLGYAAYAAANIFMDAFVKEYNRTHGKSWVSVNWDAWELREQEPAGTAREETRVELIITPPEGQEVFRRIIAPGALGRENQVIISTGDLQSRIDRWIDFKYLQADDPSIKMSVVQHSRPDIATPYSAPQSPIEQKLAQIWQELLGIDRVGGNDDFFELGGDSLKATQLVAKIKQTFNANISVREIFNTPQLGELAKQMTIPIETDNLYSHLAPVEKKEYYPVSSMQKRLYFLNEIEGIGTAYNIFFMLIIDGELNKQRMEQVYGLLISRHESFRTTFHMIDGEPAQVIHETDELDFHLEYMSCEDREEVVDDLVRNFCRPFDLTKAPLVRAMLIKLAERKHMLFFDAHHIIADYTSWLNIGRDFDALYSNRNLPGLRIQYKDFSQWGNTPGVIKAIMQQEVFWLEMLSGELPILELPTDYPRPMPQSFEGKRIKFELSGDETNGLKQIAQAHGATLFMVLLALYNVLLSKLSNLEDIMIGTAIAGRKHADLEWIVGMFVNTLVMRNSPVGNKPFGEFLADVKENTLAVFENQEYPFEGLVEKLAVARDLSRNPLFDVMLVLQNFPEITLVNQEKEVTGQGLSISAREYEQRSAKFDLTLEVYEQEGILLFYFKYCTKLFRQESILRITRYFQTIVTSVISAPTRKIMEIDILPEEERRQLLFDFNNTAAVFPADKTIPEIFAAQVEKTPDHIAVFGHGLTRTNTVNNNMIITYRQLDELSNHLAQLLNEKGIVTDDVVGLKVGPSVEMPIGILGILKSGGAYLPIAPELPRERIDYMLKDSAAKILINKSEIRNPKSETNPNDQKINVQNKNYEIPFVLDFDHLNFDIVSNFDIRVSDLTPSNLAYIIYTSGTTGRPKGTLIENKNLVNYVQWFKKIANLADNDRTVLTSSFSFDLGYTVLYPSILNGCQLHIIPKELYMSPGNLLEYIIHHRITFLKMTPLLFSTIVASEEFGQGNCGELRLIVLGGERIIPVDVNRAHEVGPQIKIMNHYGPTETTIGCIAQAIDFEKFEEFKKRPTIGYPIANMKIYILDKTMKLNPVGVPGELCVSGAGVGRGYLNRPELTAEKFNRSYKSYRTNIFYRTGDLARWVVDPAAQGAYIIDFLGRMDQQVKIRGFRIELGEIEAELMKHELVKEVVVIDRKQESGEKYLCCYVVSKEDFDLSGLKVYLAGRLPDYMIPSYFMKLQSIPLTANGKVDRKALQSYKTTLGTGVEYIAPGSDLEQQIADSWKEVLKLEKVSIHDNFFDRGGNSLNIIQLTNRLNKLLGKNLPVVALFQYPTISMLARHLEEDNIKNRVSPAIKTAKASQELSFTLKESTDIAVIGMAGRFPGAANIDEFWNNLKAGVESISFFTDEELREFGVSPELLNDPNYVKARGIVEGKEQFDAGFFDYIPADARLMDPQMRIFHECTWEALENAGYIPDNYDGSIGVYAGASHSMGWEARVLFSQWGQAAGEYELSHLINKDFLVTRVSYKLNLRGPAVSIQTACSTSLVAVHMACRTLIDRECDMVAAGGVTLQAAGKVGYRYQEGMILSPDGHCRPFDARSGGTVNGEGIGVVILKRLKEAEADGDNIYAVVKGSAINNDGFNKVGYEAPSVEGQREAIAKALLLAGVEPETVSYVETHGTGTALGDPIEIKALTLAFATEKRNYCAIGSVKSNVGHLDSAAGMAGFIKTVMALCYREIPPSLHFKTPNPAIDFENSPFYVNTQLRPWKSNGCPLRAGVSAFGIGGTNAHVVLEEWPAVKRNRERDEERKGYQLILLSTKTYPALAEMRERLAGFLKEKPALNLADTAYTLQVGRKTFKHRAILTASSGEEASDLLKSADNIQYHLLNEEKQNIVFMFPGQGSQYVGMARKLYENEPIFRLEMDRCFEHLYSLTGYDFKKILYPSLQDNSSNDSHSNNMINQTEISQPVIFIIEYALAQLLMAWGIKPRSMIGHSIGEYTAACLSGVFSLADVLEIVCLRGKLMQQLPGGTMLSIPFPEEELVPMLEGMDDISLAAVNSSSLCVVSGTDEAVAEFEKQLQLQGYQSRRLQTSHAFHSYMMDPILEKFAQAVGRLTMHKPRIPYLSNVTGKWITVEDAVEPRYWTRHLRQTVRFLDGITILLHESTTPSVFIEIGPGKALSTFVRQHKDRKNRAAQVVNLVRHPQEDISDDKYLLDKVGQLWLYGITPDWKAFHSGEKRKRIPLPTYPFQRVEFQLGGNFMDIASGFRGFEMGFERGEMTAESEADLTGISLPESAQRPEISTVYVPHRNKTEQTLARIWENFFGIEKIGCNDDFFELGGDSLKAVSMVARIQKELNVRISLPDFFRTATIGELAAYIGKASYEQFQSIDSVEEKEYYGVSSAQKRLFILQQMDPGNTNYNLPQVVILEGELNPGSLGPIFKKLIQRHESLRTSFVMINEEPVQKIHKNVELEIEYYDLATGDTEEIIHHFIRAFDLAKAPLMRVGMIKEAETRYILAVDIHHIVADGVSLELLIKEFKALYIGKELAPLRVQYKDYAWWQNCEEQKEAIRQQEAYWLEQFNSEIPVLELPTDFSRPALQSFEGYSLGFEIAAPEVKGLKKLAAQEGVTLYMVLLSVITIFLAKLSNQEDIIVGTPLAGRRHADLERIIGMFVNTLPIRNFPVGEKRFKDFLGEVKARTLPAFENQDYQFEDMVEQVLVTRDVSRNPLFDVVFVLQNLEVQPGINPDINIPGLMVKPFDSKLLT
ncbi:MAG: hypothetical protein QG657_2624, partial [Acidobacteriota bacterium]|nr:hypothetical protein [Acidobacteriota bacterium]